MSVACCTTSCHLIVFCLFAHVLITLIFLCAPVVVYIHFASVFIVTCLSHRKCYQQNAVVTELLYDMVVGVVSGDVVLSVSWRMRPVSLAHSYVTGIGRFSSLDYTISFPANREGGVVYKDSWCDLPQCWCLNWSILFQRRLLSVTLCTFQPGWRDCWCFVKLGCVTTDYWSVQLMYYVCWYAFFCCIVLVCYKHDVIYWMRNVGCN